jgi:flagellar biosynthesis/type III secretory pathway M-ring protein FliF/YscJ
MTPFQWCIVGFVVAFVLWRIVVRLSLAALAAQEERAALEKDKKMGESLGIPAEVFTRRRRRR